MNVAEATQAETTDYNGWSNYELWLANLWLTNDESSYQLLLEALNQDSLRDYEKAEWLEMMLRYQLDDEIDTPCLVARFTEGCIWANRLV